MVGIVIQPRYAFLGDSEGNISGHEMMGISDSWNPNRDYSLGRKHIPFWWKPIYTVCKLPSGVQFV